jgi:hypothetical protein
MVKPLPHRVADSMKPGPPTIITTPGGMSSNLPRSPHPIRETSPLWDFNFQLLLKFRDREGHLRVPHRHVEDGHKLGAWITKRRITKKKGSLCPEEERRYNEIGFIWDVLEEQWETMFTALTQFNQREGHCNVLTRHIEHMDGGANLRLGDWLNNQRQKRRLGKLDAKREKRLVESLGVKWNNKQQETALENFDRNFDLLLVFQEREGHVRVPNEHQESANDNLGSWLRSQRSQYRQGALKLYRQKWLEVAGVTWESRK